MSNKKEWTLRGQGLVERIVALASEHWDLIDIAKELNWEYHTFMRALEQEGLRDIVRVVRKLQGLEVALCPNCGNVAFYRSTFQAVECSVCKMRGPYNATSPISSLIDWNNLPRRRPSA